VVLFGLILLKSLKNGKCKSC